MLAARLSLALARGAASRALAVAPARAALLRAPPARALAALARAATSATPRRPAPRPRQAVPACGPAAAAPRRALSDDGAVPTAEESVAVTSRGTLPGRPPLSIYYGSQTGTAMQFAFELEKAAKARGYEASVVDLEDADAAAFPLEGTLAIFIMACFGSGEPTSNAEEFYYDLLESPKYAERMAGQSFAVAGLGQSLHYAERYQAVGKAVDRRLGELGAHRLIPRGELDDSGDIEEDFEEWQASLWEALEGDQEAAAAASAAAAAPPPPPPPPPSPPAPTVAQVRERQAAKTEANVRTFSHRDPYMAPILDAHELHTPRSSRSCKHIELDISGSGIRYTTGDYVGIVPQNDADRVSELAQTLDLRLDRELDSEQHSTLRGVGGPVTLREALTRHLDISSVPRRTVFRQLAKYVEDADARERLELLASNTALGKAEYNDFVAGNQLSLLELLEVFPVPFIPEEEVVELLPPLSPRFYSIASSSESHPSAVHVAASVVDFETRWGRRHQGVCTNFLAHQEAGNSVPIFVKESLFRMPKDPRTPLIMIGAGTGVAPFRAFIEERLHLKREGVEVGPMTLFFGIGRRTEDYLYRGLLESARRSGDLNLELCCGFERKWRDFVQFRMVRPSVAESVWRHIRDGAHVYVCGDSQRMAPAVHTALVEIAHSQGGMKREEAEAFYNDMQGRASYQLDVF